MLYQFIEIGVYYTVVGDTCTLLHIVKTTSSADNQVTLKKRLEKRKQNPSKPSWYFPQSVAVQEATEREQVQLTQRRGD